MPSGTRVVLLRSSGARLAALYTAAFALAVVSLGVTTLLATRQALRAQFEERLRTEAGALEEEYRTEGPQSLEKAVAQLDQAPGALEYGLQSPNRPPVGRLGRAQAPLGWSELHAVGARREREGVTVYSTTLPGGYRLILGDESQRWEALDKLLIMRFGLAFFVVVLMGAAGGYALTRDMHRRLSAMNTAAQAIIDGDLSRRIPIRGDGDDLDRLGLTLNRMLDRIEALMESLRQVSVDVAHDLRTPLTRLRQRIEAALARRAQSDADPLLEQALTDLDAILGTFAALLRIAQIDSGRRRSGFKRTDLAEVARTVVDAFSPSAEDAGEHLNLDSGSQDGVFVEGDSELLIQMLVNLVENAMRHAGDGASISVQVAVAGLRPILVVRDNGPGVPERERQRLFDRFYRLEQSRSTPGSGLGLSLVASIARLHGAVVSLADANPGLEVRVCFGEPRPQIPLREEEPA